MHDAIVQCLRRMSLRRMSLCYKSLAQPPDLHRDPRGIINRLTTRGPPRLSTEYVEYHQMPPQPRIPTPTRPPTGPLRIPRWTLEWTLQ